MSKQTIDKLLGWGWPIARVLAALSITVGAYWVDQRITAAATLTRIERQDERLKALEETDKLQARAERAEGEWRGRMVERMDALLNRLDRIERKIDGGK